MSKTLIQEIKNVMEHYANLSSDDRVVMTLGMYLGAEIGQKLTRKEYEASHSGAKNPEPRRGAASIL